MPVMNDAGALEVSAWCSPACHAWAVEAVANARSELTPKTERQARRLFLIKELLDLRDHPDDVTFFATPTPVLTPSTEGTEVFDGR